MLKSSYPFYLAGRAVHANQDLEVLNKFTGKIATRTALADTGVVLEAIDAADRAAKEMRAMPSHARQSVLEKMVKQIEERSEEMALALCVEAGKPIRDSRVEVSRLRDTLKVSAEESVRICGEFLPLDISPRAEKYQSFWKRVPIGPCALISPWNFPLNLVAHKIGPAIASGCPFVLKPASATPVGALILGEILSGAGLPKGAFSILPLSRKSAEPLVSDERIRLLSFTGSSEVGWKLKAEAGKKKVHLELGGNAACVVEPDWDPEDAVNRLIFGAFYQSGQSCISVQRILVHESVYEDIKERLVARTKSLVCGDPLKEETFIGPIISEAEAIRIEESIQGAVAAGGKLLCGGGRRGSMIEATLLEDVPENTDIIQDEIFGPAAVLSSYSSYNEALDQVNRSRFGLQAGIFTKDMYKALDAWNRLEVGGVVIGDIPGFRVDHMPYGGVKDSGLGREGVRWSIEEMTECRLMVVRTP